MIYTVLDGKKGWFFLSLECVYHEGEFDLNVFGLMKVGPYEWRSLSGAPHFVVYPDSRYCGSFLLCVMRRWLPPFPNKLPFSQAFQEISEVFIEHNSASFRYLELRLIFSLTSSLTFWPFHLWIVIVKFETPEVGAELAFFWTLIWFAKRHVSQGFLQVKVKPKAVEESGSICCIESRCLSSLTFVVRCLFSLTFIGFVQMFSK